jgi:hypothetical protein
VFSLISLFDIQLQPRVYIRVVLRRKMKANVLDYENAKTFALMQILYYIISLNFMSDTNLTIEPDVTVQRADKPVLSDRLATADHSCSNASMCRMSGAACWAEAGLLQTIPAIEPVSDLPSDSLLHRLRPR